ncbi:MAG: two-component system sensor histidine kinase/response regulator [Paraglaciecola sp.]|jgi:two-component system sensor histidine kinase/response regulator
MGNCQVNLGNYNVGLPLLKRSLAIATETGSVDELSAVYRSLAKCYEKMGNYRLALGYQKSWEHILDSLFTVDQNKQLANIQTLYETEKKEKLIIE